MRPAAEARVSKLAALAISRCGLAWAAKLPLATELECSRHEQMPPRVALRYTPRDALVRALEDDEEWLGDEEERLAVAAAWLRARPRGSVRDALAALALLGVL